MAYTFLYSKENTAARQENQISEEVKKERFDRLLNRRILSAGDK